MLCPQEIAAIVNAAAVALSEGRSIEELNILAAIFTQIGDTLATIAVQTENLQSFCNNCSSNNINSDPLD